MRKFSLTILIAAAAVFVLPASVLADPPAHHPVAIGDQGFKVMLTRSDSAENLSGEVARAEAAIAACNEAEFSSVMRRIGDIKQGLEGLRDGSDQALEFSGLTRAQAQRDAGALELAEQKLNQAWRAAQPCGGAAEPERNVSVRDGSQPVEPENRLEVSGGVKRGIMKPNKSGYLGTRIGAGADLLPFITHGDSLVMTAVGLSFAYNFLGFNTYNAPNVPNAYNTYNIFNLVAFNYMFGRVETLKLIGEVERGTAEANEGDDFLETNGANLLIPGVGIGPNGAGFFLPGPNTDITNANYRSEHDYLRFLMGLEADIQTPNPNLRVSPLVGVEYGHATTRNMFSGDVPAFVRSFAYDSKTEVHTISPTVGLKAEYKVSDYLSVLGGARYSYNFNDGEGYDSLDFTGFANQTATMKSDRGTHSAGVEAGVIVTPDPIDLPNITVTLGGGFRSDGNVPVVKTRDGQDISDFHYEDSQTFYGTLRTTFKF